jgi:hypothetical protein
MECYPVDAQNFRGPRLVAATLVQHTQDVRAFHVLQTASSSGSWATTIARSTAFSNSRTLPGQLYCCNPFMAAGETLVIRLLISLENFRTK